MYKISPVLFAHETRHFDTSKEAFDFLKLIVIPNAKMLPIFIEGPIDYWGFDERLAKKQAAALCMKFYAAYDLQRSMPLQKEKTR